MRRAGIVLAEVSSRGWMARAAQAAGCAGVTASRPLSRGSRTGLQVAVRRAHCGGELVLAGRLWPDYAYRPAYWIRNIGLASLRVWPRRATGRADEAEPAADAGPAVSPGVALIRSLKNYSAKNELRIERPARDRPSLRPAEHSCPHRQAAGIRSDTYLIGYTI